LDTMPLGLR
jgi:hypothetical protein